VQPSRKHQYAKPQRRTWQGIGYRWFHFLAAPKTPVAMDCEFGDFRLHVGNFFGIWFSGFFAPLQTSTTVGATVRPMVDLSVDTLGSWPPRTRMAFFHARFLSSFSLFGSFLVNRNHPRSRRSGNRRGTSLGIIPARGGSKGVVRKNVRPLAGKRLVGYAIDAAIESRCLTSFVTSTNDADVAKSCGSPVIMRPRILPPMIYP